MTARERESVFQVLWGTDSASVTYACSGKELQRDGKETEKYSSMYGGCRGPLRRAEVVGGTR